jgi:tryptophan synthase alpha chain
MSRIEELFARKKRNVLNVYFTAGFPTLNSTVPVMKALQDAGVDMIELGIPYSDPLADGPVIQSSSAIALANGMTIRKLFEQLKDFRKKIQLPVLLMGYMNPVIQYGFWDFCRDAANAGADGLILPDLPMFEFQKEYAEIIKESKLDFVFMVTPETAASRIRQLDALSSGFLYAVSSSSTTGNNTTIGDQSAYFKMLQSLGLKNPILVGFGIRDKSSFSAACEYTNGAIIGTAFIKVLENVSEREIEVRTLDFIKSLK